MTMSLQEIVAVFKGLGVDHSHEAIWEQTYMLSGVGD